MSQKIYKCRLEIADKQAVSIPRESEILCVQVQNGNPYIWFKCDDIIDQCLFKFELFGTGQKMDDNVNRKYIGTFQMHDGSLVWHLFQILE